MKMTINCIFCSAFPIWSLVLAEKPQRDEIFSAGCTLRNLYLKQTDRVFHIFVAMRDVLLKTVKSTATAESKLSFTSTVASRIAHSQNPSCERQGHTQWHIQTHANTHTHSIPRTLAVFSSFFPTLCLVRHEWQSYFLRRLDYYSVKPVIGLDSSYLSLVKYGSL